MNKLHFIFLAGMTAALISGCSKKPAETTPATGSGPAVELKLKWNVGKRYVNQLTMDQKALLSIPGYPSPLGQETTMAQGVAMSALKALPDGATQMEMEFTSFSFENKVANTVKMAFDSSADPSKDDPKAAPMRHLVGARFRYEMDAAGKADKVEGMEDFLTHLAAGDAQTQALLKSILSDDLVKQLAMRGQGLPAKPVKMGEEWAAHLDENAGSAGVMQMDMKYTFKGWEQHDGRKCALIEFGGDIQTKPGTGTSAVTVEKGTIRGKEWFDLDLGMMIETDSDQHMNMKLMAQGRTINSEMNQNVDMKLTSVTDISK